MNFQKILQYISTKPFDVQTEEGRANERYRLAAWSTLSSGTTKILSVILMIESVRLTLPYLGTERFGIWMTISSFIGVLSFLDFGIGNALTNRVAHCASKQNQEKLQSVISGGIGVLATLGIISSVGLIITASAVPWELLIKTETHVFYEEIRSAGMLFGGLFGLQIFAGGLQKIFSGLQKAYVANAMASCGNIFSLALLYLAADKQMGICELIFITIGTNALANSALIVFLIKKDLFIPRITKKSICIEHKPLLNSSGLFFILQIGTMVGWHVDPLIISSTLGPSQVALFGIAQKMFQIISQPLSIINGPLWSAYADSYARNDHIFIQKTLKKSLLLTSSIAATLGLILLKFSTNITTHWTHGTLSISTSLFLAFFIWTFFESLGSSFSMFLNGCSIIKPQIYAVISLIIISIPVKLFCIANFGISGMIIGFTIIYTINILIFFGIIYRADLLKIYEGKR